MYRPMGLEASPAAPQPQPEPDPAAAEPSDEEHVARIQRGLQNRTVEYSPAQKREWASLNNIAHQLADDDNYNDDERQELAQQIEARRRAIFLNPLPRLAEERPQGLADALPETTLDLDCGPGITAKVQRVQDANGNWVWQGLRNTPNPLLAQQAIATTALELLRMTDTDAAGKVHPRFRSPDEALAAARALYGATQSNSGGPEPASRQTDPLADPAAWIHQNPSAAADLAATDQPSRTQWNRAGLPRGVQAPDRKAFVTKLRAALARNGKP